MKSPDAAAYNPFDFRTSRVSLFAARKSHQLDDHFLTDDKLQTLTEIVDLVSYQHMRRVLLFLLHRYWLLVLAYGLLYLVLTAAYLEVYVGELVFEGVELFVVHFYGLFEVSYDLLDRDLCLEFGVGELSELCFLTFLQLFGHLHVSLLFVYLLDYLHFFLVSLLLFFILRDHFYLVLLVFGIFLLII